jgi:hypothetical protein
VATFRAEADYQDGRHPDKVTFANAEADAQRRDFTVNGLFYDPVTEKIHDWVGGKKDLRAKIIRTIGAPQDRFAEDHLRLLRAVRFAAQLDFEIDPKTVAAIKRLAPKIELISAERIRDELIKLFSPAPFGVPPSGGKTGLGSEPPEGGTTNRTPAARGLVLLLKIVLLWLFLIGNLVFWCGFWIWWQRREAPVAAPMTEPDVIRTMVMTVFGMIFLAAGVGAYAAVIFSNCFTSNFTRPIWVTRALMGDPCYGVTHLQTYPGNARAFGPRLGGTGEPEIPP